MQCVYIGFWQQKAWNNYISVGPAVFLSGTQKLGEAGPAGPLKKITIFRAADGPTDWWKVASTWLWTRRDTRPMPYRWAWVVLQEGRGSYMGGCGLFTIRLDRAVILMYAFTRSLVHSFARLLVFAFYRSLVCAFACLYLHLYAYWFLPLQNRVLV